jgi:hypothetical protein
LLEVGWDIVADERQLLVDFEVDEDVVGVFEVDNFGVDIVVGVVLETVELIVELIVELVTVGSRQ